MKHGLPSLTALRAFEAVCRCGSVTHAAAELSVTPGAVSRQLKYLSEELEIELFRRKGNRLFITTNGAKVRDAVTEGFGTIQRNLESLKIQRASKPIALGCSPTFAMHWLLPRMSRLNASYPGLTLHVVPLPNGPDAAMPGSIDAWIDQGRWPADEKILTAPFRLSVSVLAMSADYARRHGPFRKLDDLRKLTLLTNHHRPESLEDWSKEDEYRTREDKVVHAFDDFFLTLQSVRIGLGYAFAPEAYFEDELADGRIVAPFGAKRRAVPFYLAWSRSADSERLAPLIRWLRHEGKWPADTKGRV